MKQEQKVNILGVTGFVIRHIKFTIDQERATGILNPTAKKPPDKTFEHANISRFITWSRNLHLHTLSEGNLEQG